MTATAIGNTATPRVTTGRAGTTTPTGCAKEERNSASSFVIPPVCLRICIRRPFARIRQLRSCAPTVTARGSPASTSTIRIRPLIRPPNIAPLFEPDSVNAPLFRHSDLAQQKQLAAIDFQSQARDPSQLDIKSPILPQTATPGLVEAESEGARDARTLIAAYYAMIKLIDDQLGRILAALDETGLRENTVIIFTSDHGEALGDHGLIQKGCRFFDGLTRVPLIWSWRGHIEAGRRHETLVELTDIAPTLLDLIGLPIPNYCVGRSLLPLLRGEADPNPREFVRCEFIDALDMPDHTRATMFFDGRHKLNVYHNHGLGELYDMRDDPGEFENLWDSGAHQSLKAELLQRAFDATINTLYPGLDRIGPM